MSAQRRSDVLVCIPCFNSEPTLGEVVGSLVENSDADVLLIDDGSDQPLANFVQKNFADYLDRITVIRPAEKNYTGGAKNIGLRRALRMGYRTIVLMDSDIVVPETLIARAAKYFEDNPAEVIVAPAILPYGRLCQYTDTLINFSDYLPDRNRELSWKNCLAGYACAINMQVFQRNPCFFPQRIGGDDVLFFRQLKKNFNLGQFPLLNGPAVLHKPPRAELRKVLAAQKRYARAFFSHNDQQRTYLFNKLPLLHFLTPRFALMLVRLIKRRRFRDFAYLPLCWYLDFNRALQIVRLSFEGYRDPGNVYWHRSDKAMVSS